MLMLRVLVLRAAGMAIGREWRVAERWEGSMVAWRWLWLRSLELGVFTCCLRAERVRRASMIAVAAADVVGGAVVWACRSILLGK